MSRFPALELLWSPTGAGAVVRGHSWPLGEQHALGEGLSFGIEGDVRLRFPPSSEGRELCKIEQRDGKLKLWHFIGRHHCAVNGRLVEERELELHHRDLVAMPGGPVLRVLQHPSASAHSATLEAAIEATPDDAELWRVYGDFLLDHGDPLGERLVRARTGAAEVDAPWLDALAAHYEAGRLEVEWRHGVAVKATLRDALQIFRSLEDALRHLVGLRVMRFLRDLTLDVTSDRCAVLDGLAALDRVSLPKSLRRISLGDVPESLRERVGQQLASARRPVEVGFFRDAQLQVLSCAAPSPEPTYRQGEQLRVGDRLELGQGAGTSALTRNLLLGGSHMIGRDAGRFVLARLSQHAELAKVNGRWVDRFPLRDGDVIELADQLSARFTLVR